MWMSLGDVVGICWKSPWVLSRFLERHVTCGTSSIELSRCVRLSSFLLFFVSFFLSSKPCSSIAAIAHLFLPVSIGRACLLGLISMRHQCVTWQDLQRHTELSNCSGHRDRMVLLGGNRPAAFQGPCMQQVIGVLPLSQGMSTCSLQPSHSEAMEPNHRMEVMD